MIRSGSIHEYRGKVDSWKFEYTLCGIGRVDRVEWSGYGVTTICLRLHLFTCGKCLT